MVRFITAVVIRVATDSQFFVLDVFYLLLHKYNLYFPLFALS